MYGENMMNGKNSIPPPKEVAARMYCGRLGRILCSFSAVCALLCLLEAASFLLTAAVVFAGIMLIVVTIGVIFRIVPDYWDKFTGWIDGSSYVAAALEGVLPYIAGAGVLCGVLAVVLLALDREKRHPAAITVAVIAAALALGLAALAQGR